MRLVPIASILLLAAPSAMLAQAAPSDQVPLGYITHRAPHTSRGTTADGSGGVLGHRSTGGVLGVDSIPNWSSYFYDPGFDSFGGTQYTWQYTMAGNSPFAQNGFFDDGGEFSGSTTRIGAPIVPVMIDLRNADGSPRSINGVRLVLSATPLVGPVLKSPVFSNAPYDSSERPTQFADAVQRAEFFHQSSDDWHTLLTARVATPRTLVLLKGSYQFALNADGTLAYVLADSTAFANAFFPSTPTDTSTPIGAAENSGDIRTRDISTFLFNNLFLTSGASCCTIGFHTYDVEPGDQSNGFRERRFVLNYSSWISPGLFADPTFGDVSALSHEVSETLNDPFVNNATPWWLAPNGNCQNNLEDGDGIEGLPNAQYPITLNGYTYHPQNETLLQWFAQASPSSAIHHAYSYPDTTVLTGPATLQLPNCAKH